MGDYIDHATPSNGQPQPARTIRKNLYEQLALVTTGYQPEREKEQQEISYYDYPVLKAPVWSWEIVWYFFFGGLAAGCYVIASIASLFGSKEDQVVTRTGYYLSLLALLPCPPLLIKDLGKPERFLHMMRVFKVQSPMSMGVWGILTFSFFSGITTMIQAARDGLLGKWWGARWLASWPQKLLAVPGSIAGVFLGGYTGVLLAATSIPLWSRSKFMGAIFIASALSTSGALISLVLHLTQAPARTLKKLERLEVSNMLIELTGILIFLRQSRRVARPLVGSGPEEHGRTFWRFMFGGGLVLPLALQFLLLQTKNHKKSPGGVSLLISGLILMGGYFLRRTMIDAGHSSSKDARTVLWNARKKH
ncbi:NrfD/PsrC family molybdoenzyme membrane anchor subunit [Tengunoibacter tsumagoiensis]|uniref:Polysulfide reductase n=1 Tax=Tengunoibacter tsumagoiensis TaxID=2014871 RepID=A0A402A2D1_9CHLR|nr:NrfD/PsrC family molybdoenzyme membrane anchor subunit [Tengunoibacter tsumagoiensis]GCE13215.1 hypothetical protein KTT_30740 [Tengunoibacter tsumagoiensis]